jgi:hypothetical protein
MTPLRLLTVAGGIAGAAAFSALTWAISRAAAEVDRRTGLHTFREPSDEHAMWVARLRRQAELDAIELSIRRHPAGKRRPR